MTILYNQSHLRSYRKKLRKTLTKSEAVFWMELKNSQLGYKCRRQHSIGNYILDFYCPTLRLGIELDGYTHLDHEQWNTDIKRQEFLQRKGIHILRFSDTQIIDTLGAAVTLIRNTCIELDT